MNLNCLSGIITDRLAIHIDITNTSSWNLNTDLTSVSLTEWSGAISEDTELLDFGLTAYDNGRVNDMEASLTTTALNTKLTLYRVGENNAVGTTSYSNYTMSPITGVSTGNYFQLNGGYLQGFFKLQGEEYEVLPARYGEGITVETVVKLDNNLTTGIFYFMGARAEDKYNPYYSGETEAVITTATTTVKGGYSGEYIEYTNEVTGFTGITTSEGNYLHAFIDTSVQKDNFYSFEEKEEIIPIEQERNNIYDNAIGFFITEDRKLGVRRVNEEGKIKVHTSTNVIPTLGWHILAVSFRPYEIITDEEELKCEPRRKGVLTFYVDGRKFYEIEDYDEFYFKDFKNDKEKTYGVPYNVSWGGGSFGLKHSWHWSDFNKTSLVQDSRKSGLTIEKNFNDSFIGGIQKLRIYDFSLNSQEILSNAYWESVNSPDINVAVTRGGRIIIQNI